MVLKLVENEVNDRSKSKKDSESNLTRLNDILSKLKNGDTSVKKLLDTKEKAFLKKLGFELDEKIGRGLLAVKSKEPWKLANEIESYMSKNNETQKEDLRAAREKLSYLQDNEERLIKRDGKEKYDKRLKQAKEEVSKLKGNKEPEKKVYDVTLGWNKKDQSTYNQIDKITDMLEERGELSDWPFRSISQAQKRISFSEASNIISALSRGERIKIYI